MKHIGEELEVKKKEESIFGKDVKLGLELDVVLKDLANIVQEKSKIMTEIMEKVTEISFEIFCN